MRTSCISHPPRDPFYLIRSSYMRICEGDACEAALLALWEFWTNGLLTESDGYTDVPIHATWDYLEECLLGLYERKKIGRSLKRLTDRGFLIHDHGGYILVIDAVQEAVMPVPKGTDPSPKRDQPPVPKGTADYIEEGSKEVPPFKKGNGKVPPNLGPSYTELLDQYPRGHNPKPQLACQNFISRFYNKPNLAQSMVKSLTSSGWLKAWDGGRMVPDLHNWIRDWEPDASVTPQKRLRSAEQELADL